jgi:hypothetical protein
MNRTAQIIMKAYSDHTRTCRTKVHMGKPVQLALCLALYSIAVVCNAQTAEPDLSTTIPAWVKVDKALLAENTYLEKPADRESSLIRQNLAAHTAYAPAPWQPARPFKLSSADFNKKADDPRVPNPAEIKDTDTPPGNYRPTVTTVDEWKVSMPNVRRHVAHLVLQRSF